MQKSELLTKIVNDYCAQGDEQKFQKGVLEAFCEYATKWLVDNNCVGTATSASGLALRFGDGRELSLFSNPDAFYFRDTPAVAISATKEKRAVTTTSERNTSVPITGR